MALSLTGLYQEAVNLLGLGIHTLRRARMDVPASIDAAEGAGARAPAEHGQALARLLLEASTFSGRLGNYDLLLAQAAEALDTGVALGDVELQAAAYQRISAMQPAS